MKICEQKPDVLKQSGLNIERIRNTWPGSEAPTARTIPYQLGEIRKEIKAGCVIKPGTNTNAVNGYQGTPKTPRVKSLSSTPASNKRGASGDLKGTPTKKAKTSKRKGKDSDEESSVAVDSSDEAKDETGDDADGDDTPLSTIPKVTERRKLPARSKSRSKSYVLDNGSSGEDAGARDADSDVDAAFDPEAGKISEAEREKGRAALRTLLKNLGVEATNDDVNDEFDVQMESANDADHEAEEEIKNESDNETERTFATAKE